MSQISKLNSFYEQFFFHEKQKAIFWMMSLKHEILVKLDIP